MLSILRGIKGRLPESAHSWIQRIRRPRLAYLPFRPLKPVSRCGFGRGLPVDRYYIEQFLEESRALVRGVTLEVKDDTYTKRFGGSAVTRGDVLDIDPANKTASIIGDLRSIGSIPTDTYDTIILTQVLQYIDDVHAAVAELHRILKPGGTALITVPFLMILDPRAVDFWRFTPHSLKYLLGRHFAEKDLHIEPRGNMLTGVAFWMGFAADELRRKHLQHRDPTYSCLMTARATKAAGPSAAV